MRDGVTMRDPSTVYLDWDVTLAPDVTLEPNVILRGATSIGEGTVIGAGSQIIDSDDRRARVVWASIVESSTIEDEPRSARSATSAPAASSVRGRRGRQLRRAQEHPPRRGLEAAPHELPRRRRGRRRRNIGAGTITANYDGTRKHRTTIGDGAFIGVDTMIVAPRDIGDGAPGPGAGAVVTKDVPPASSPSACRRGSASRAPNPRPAPAEAVARDGRAPSEPAVGDAPRERAPSSSSR